MMPKTLMYVCYVETGDLITVRLDQKAATLTATIGPHTYMLLDTTEESLTVFKEAAWMCAFVNHGGRLELVSHAYNTLEGVNDVLGSH